jgi:hypothetical protein
VLRKLNWLRRQSLSEPAGSLKQSSRRYIRRGEQVEWPERKTP